MSSTTSRGTGALSDGQGRHGTGGHDANRADTWPGPAAPLSWLARLALTGAVIGGLLGLLLGATAAETSSASATVEVVPDSQVLNGPLATVTQSFSNDTLVTGELEALDALRLAQEQTADDAVALTVTQVGTSDALRIAATAPTPEVATAQVQSLLDAYVASRRATAEASVNGSLTAVQQRLDALDVLDSSESSPLTTEAQRLLAQQSDLQAAATRIDAVVPVLRAPTVDQASGASPVVLDTILGAVLGAVLALAAGAIWRATSGRLFDARTLVAAGVPVMLPRLPAGRVRGRSQQLPARMPTPKTLASARLLVPQVLDVSTAPASLAVLGADERSGAAEVAWELAWAMSSSGAPVALLTTTAASSARHRTGDQPVGEAVGSEHPLAPTLTVVELPANADAESVAAAVRRQATAGRHVLLHTPALTAGVLFSDVARFADQAVVVVGEGVSTLEGSLAAVRDVASSGTRLCGVVVTTNRSHLGRARAGAPSPRPAAEEAPAPRQEPVRSEA
ncbi:hypothetical protein [Modestobacter sp. SSW1-42]|uniref:hypothetical protein n=1 Tax=Modestobacter sp. SSW1-42 TaxID=596372 RepID=UPI003987E865